jgi:hypothetical protein
MSKRTGDTSRRRRVADPARLAFYSNFRALRFSRRMFGGPELGASETRESPREPSDDVGLKGGTALPSV